MSDDQRIRTEMVNGQVYINLRDLIAGIASGYDTDKYFDLNQWMKHVCMQAMFETVTNRPAPAPLSPEDIMTEAIKIFRDGADHA